MFAASYHVALNRSAVTWVKDGGVVCKVLSADCLRQVDECLTCGFC
jgi:hypothetical protein